MDEERRRRAEPTERMRHENDGLAKRCPCPRRKWIRCSHEWHFDFYHKKRRHRFPLAKVAGQPVTTKSDAEQWADSIRAQIRAGTFTDPHDDVRPIPGSDARLTFGVPSLPDAEVSDTVKSILNPKLLDNAIWLDWATMGQKASEWRQRWERDVKSRL